MEKCLPPKGVWGFSPGGFSQTLVKWPKFPGGPWGPIPCFVKKEFGGFPKKVLDIAPEGPKREDPSELIVEEFIGFGL